MSFFRDIKTKSGVYRAEVMSYRKDGKVKQKVVRWLGKQPATEEELREKIKRIDAKRKQLYTEKDQLSQEVYEFESAKADKASKEALKGRCYAYVNVAFGSSNYDGPNYGDRVEIKSRKPTTCTVKFKKWLWKFHYKDLSPEPLNNPTMKALSGAVDKML